MSTDVTTAVENLRKYVQVRNNLRNECNATLHQNLYKVWNQQSLHPQQWPMTTLLGFDYEKCRNRIYKSQIVGDYGQASLDYDRQSGIAKINLEGGFTLITDDKEPK